MLAREKQKVTNTCVFWSDNYNYFVAGEHTITETTPCYSFVD